MSSSSLLSNERVSTQLHYMNDEILLVLCCINADTSHLNILKLSAKS